MDFIHIHEHYYYWTPPDFSSAFIWVGEGEQHYGCLSVCMYQSAASIYAAKFKCVSDFQNNPPHYPIFLIFLSIYLHDDSIQQ